MTRPPRQHVVRPASVPVPPAPPKPALLQAPSVDPLASGIPTKGMPLASFLNGVKTSLQQTHEVPTWIQAELAFAQAKQHFWSLGLQEMDDQGNKIAATEAVVWSSDLAQVVERFEAVTGQALAAGMKVLLQVQVQFSPQWGFRLACKNISPQWTLGEAAVQRQQLREQLIDEGLWDRNQSFPAPRDFTHVAVVAPHASAGLEDFLREAERLESLGLCRFTLFHAPFEGPNAPLLLPQALAEAGQVPGIDAVCLIRGGGAAAGIAWLDHEAIVRAAAKLPVPLLTGIGHERDTPLVEELASMAAGTPSKAIGLITARITQQAHQAQQAWATITRLATERVAQAHHRLARQHQDIAHHAGRLVQHARQAVDALAREALGLGPQATLNRGYALVTDAQGQLISQAPEGANVPATLRFQDKAIPVLLSPTPPVTRPRKKKASP